MDEFSLPDSLLLDIFRHLDNYIDLLSASVVSKQWYKVSKDESLWKKLFIWDFSPTRFPTGIKFRWLEEYKRLKYEAPTTPAEYLDNGHSDEVLHVAFSHDSSLFASCSKDSFIKVWQNKYPCKLKYERNLKVEFGWIYTQSAQFSDDDALLLVSGVKPCLLDGDPASGDIAIFQINEDSLNFCCRSCIRPYDFFGCWYNSTWFLSCDYEYVSNATSLSTISLCRSSQETQSERKRITSQLFKFLNLNASSIRTIAVGKYVSQWLKRTISAIKEITEPACSIKQKPSPSENANSCPVNVENDDKLLIFTCGSKTFMPHQIGFKIVDAAEVESKLEEEVMPQRRLELVKERLKQMRENGLNVESLVAQTPPNPLQQLFNNMQQGQHMFVNVDNPDQQPQQLNEEIIRAFFNLPDHVINMNGHITGLCLSHDHKELYVNVRSWPENVTDIVDPWNPPPISQNIETRVIDLETLTVRTDISYRGHLGFTPNNECVFIFLDASSQYVASGSEDKNAYLWDRRFGNLIKKYQHNGVVNSVGFSPRFDYDVDDFNGVDDGRIFITASDDKTLRVWRSRKSLQYLSNKAQSGYPLS